MRLIAILIFFFLFNACSFDEKTGIWQDQNNPIQKKNNVFNEFKTLSSSAQIFDKIIYVDPSFKFNLQNEIANLSWKDKFFNQSNNSYNFKYIGNNKLIQKSKKISRHKLNNFFLVENDNVIFNDERGNIFVHSLLNNKEIRKYNFYKKQFKKIKKNLNMILENQIIYVSDNIGYLYAYDIKKDKVLWAKNYKTPFRSNIKIIKDKLIAANQNNILYFFDKKSGDIIKSIPTEENTIKNEFISNLSSNEKYTFFLNTYGSLYAVDNNRMRILWFINLNQSIDLNPSNLFEGNQIVINKDKISVSSNRYTYVLDMETGSIIYKNNFTTFIKSLIINDYIFHVTKNNLLIAIYLKTGEIIYSVDINEEIAKFLKTKKRKTEFLNIFMVNGKLFIFLKSSYILKFSVNGNLDEIQKLPIKINSNPIFLNKLILFISNKSKLSVVN